MAKIVKLTDAQAKKLTAPGRYCVDSNLKLYLEIKTSGHKTWLLRTDKSWRKLADYSNLSLTSVRGVLSRETNELITATFKQAAIEYINLKSANWKSLKSLGQWQQSLNDYAYPHIGNLPCDKIRHHHILKLASPIWSTKTETCRRVIQRISAVLQYEHRRLHIPFINPTDDLNLTLGKPKLNVKHHAAPTLDALRLALQTFNSDYPSHRCFRFMAFTICRSGEARHALNNEIMGNIWQIPGDKMKAGKLHRVPLTNAALACFNADNRLLFDNNGKPLSDMALSMLLRKNGFDFVPHGIRACFRSWCAENAVDFAVAELCLAHSIKDKIVAAYQRSDLLEQRREVLERWAGELLRIT